MPYTINYTDPENVELSDLEEWSINQDKTVKVILKNGKSFKMSILDRWSTYSSAEKTAFKKILKDTMENAEDENGNTPDSVGGDL